MPYENMLLLFIIKFYFVEINSTDPEIPKMNPKPLHLLYGDLPAFFEAKEMFTVDSKVYMHLFKTIDKNKNNVLDICDAKKFVPTFDVNGKLNRYFPTTT